jgi:hypothetical protein
VRTTIQSLVAVLVAASLIFAAAAPIGIAKANGDFLLDSAVVRSNATVLDGSTLETAASRLQVVFNDGTRLMLAEASRSKLYGDHAVLEKGATELAGADKYRIDALGLKVTPDSDTSVAQVNMNKSDRIVVTAAAGAVRVTNSVGVLVARVFPGKALELNPQAGGTETTTRIAGVLEKKNGKFFLTDTTTSVTFEVQGTDLNKYAGKQVELTGVTVVGATPAPGATQVINASLVTLIGKAAGATAAAGILASSGLTVGGVVVVAGVVVAGATLGGLAAAGEFSGSHGNVSRP